MPGELISRDQLDRIVRRAAELQTHERDIGEGLTEDEVLALGREVGIPAQHLRQALLEERTRVDVEAPGGPWAWLAGPRRIAAGRVVPGDRAAVERALAAWMEQEELLQVKRRYADRTTWEPKPGTFASIQRALNVGGRSYTLAKSAEIAGQVTPLETGFCHVRLSADVGNHRAARTGGLVALTALGAAAGWAVALAGLAPPIGVAAAVAFALGGVGVARTHARENDKVQVALEQVLDRLERGEIRGEHRLPGPRPSPLGRIAEELRRTFGV